MSATQNETMRQLTTATLIFLPLSFLAGYFGMNFNVENWHVLTNNGPIYFWIIAIPSTMGILLIIGFAWIRRLLTTLTRQIKRKNIKIKLKRNREMRRHKGLSISTVPTIERDDEAEGVNYGESTD
jgi:CorA-like Mg2+ transporter protein